MNASRSAPPPVLEARGLTRSFGGVVAVDSLDLVVRAGEAVGIIGPNGAGKTTLFNLLAGTLSASTGSTWLDGRDISGWSPDRRCRNGLSRTFQVTLPFVEMSTLENAMIGALARGRGLGEAQQIAHGCLEKVGLAHMAARPASQLSTGQRKRLELARVLSTSPVVVLLDEVTGGVDQASIPGLVEVVRRLREDNVTLVVIEHNMTVIQQLAERLVFMDQGRKVMEGSVREVADSDVVRSIYLGERRASA